MPGDDNFLPSSPLPVFSPNKSDQYALFWYFCLSPLWTCFTHKMSTLLYLVSQGRQTAESCKLKSSFLCYIAERHPSFSLQGSRQPKGVFLTSTTIFFIFVQKQLLGTVGSTPILISSQQGLFEEHIFNLAIGLLQDDTRCRRDLYFVFVYNAGATSSTWLHLAIHLSNYIIASQRIKYCIKKGFFGPT